MLLKELGHELDELEDISGDLLVLEVSSRGEAMRHVREEHRARDSDRAKIVKELSRE
jgi:hypothetical protein